jgi:hypothetical protein
MEIKITVTDELREFANLLSKFDVDKSVLTMPEVDDANKLGSLYRMTGAKTYLELHNKIKELLFDSSTQESESELFSELTGPDNPPLDKYGTEVINAVNDARRISKLLKFASGQEAETLKAQYRAVKAKIGEMGLSLNRAGYRIGVGLVFGK